MLICASYLLCIAVRGCHKSQDAGHLYHFTVTVTHYYYYYCCCCCCYYYLATTTTTNVVVCSTSSAYLKRCSFSDSFNTRRPPTAESHKMLCICSKNSTHSRRNCCQASRHDSTRSKHWLETAVCTHSIADDWTVSALLLCPR